MSKVLHCAGCNRYRKHSQHAGPCKCGGAFVWRAFIPVGKRKIPGNRLPKGVSEGIVAAYLAGKSLTQVGREFPNNGRARSYGSIRELLVRRGISIRETPMSRRKYDPANGRLLPKVERSDSEIRALVNALPRMMVPLEIKHEYLRKWSVERRRWLLGLLRERFPSTLPTGELVLKGAKFFDPVTAEARAIAAKLNAGRTSRNAAVKLDIRSEGIIFEGGLWFWSSKVGYLNGVYRPGTPRRLLHWELWERYHGRPVPAGHVVRHGNGNKNDFRKGNLVLVTRNCVARENQLGALMRKADATLAALVAGGARLNILGKLKTKGATWE